MSFAFGLELELLEKERAWKEKRAAYMKEYKRKNKETLKVRYREKNKEYRKKNKGRWKKRVEKLVPNSPKHLARLEKQRSYRKQNAERINKMARERHRALSPEARRKRNSDGRKSVKKRLKRDPTFAMIISVKNRILGAINGKPKKNKTQENRFRRYFGCSQEVLRTHIEAQFTDGMTWENRGTFWHLDHIVPFSLGGDNYDLLLKLNHYKNLQPLVVAENVRKGKTVPDIWPEGVPFTREELGLPSVSCPTPVSVLPVLASV